MMKFKIYRAIAGIYFLLIAFSGFLTRNLSRQWLNVRTTIVISLGIAFLICYSLLISIFNYYKEPVWKRISVILFITGNLIFNFVYVVQAYKYPAYNFISLSFYLPMIIAFVTIQKQEIRPLAVSYAYIMLVICILRIGLPYLRDMIDLSSYSYFLTAVFLLPSVFVIALFHKMVMVSGRVTEGEMKDERDLL